MKHNHLLRSILLTTSICALLTTSVLAMEQEDTPPPPSKKRKEQSESEHEHTPLQQQPDNPLQKKPKRTLSSENLSSNQSNLIINEPPQQNNQQQEKKPKPSVPMADEKNPFHNMPTGVFNLITDYLHPKDAGRLKQTSKTMNEKVKASGNRALDLYNSKKDSQIPENSNIAVSALFKAARMGHQEARQIVAEKIYKKLSTQNDPAIKFSLCMNLAKNGLFLLLQNEEQKAFIPALYDLAKDDITGAREAFLGLSKDLTNMEEGVQRWFIDRLYIFARDDIGDRKVFLELSNDMDKMTKGGQVQFIWELYLLAKYNEDARAVFFGLSNRIGEMTEGGQIEFIMHLAYLARDKIEGARDAFFGLISQMDKMKPSVPEFYKKMLEELKKKK